MGEHVVVWDPSGEYWEGGLVSAEAATLLRGRRVATLPVQTELVGRSGIGGWSKRSWGAGWSLSSAVPRLVCPLALYVVRDAGASPGASARRLNFVLRVVPETDDVLARVRAGAVLSGAIRLASDSGQPGGRAGGFSAAADTAVDVSRIGAPDVDDGWTLYGGAEVVSPVDGILALGLYASAPGLRVAWAAASQSR